MSSYRRKLNPRREKFVQLFSRMIEQLQKAYEYEHKTNGLTMEILANRLGISKSRVSKILSGNSNLTIESLSNIAYELGVECNLKINNNDVISAPYPAKAVSNVPAGVKNAQLEAYMLAYKYGEEMVRTLRLGEVTRGCKTPTHSYSGTSAPTNVIPLFVDERDAKCLN